jgi:hypothetical protein
MKFDPQRRIVELGMVYQKEITELGACAYLMPDSLNRGRDLFWFRRNFLGDQWKRSLRSSWQS